jgi:hypothetical protein
MDKVRVTSRVDNFTVGVIEEVISTPKQVFRFLVDIQAYPGAEFGKLHKEYSYFLCKDTEEVHKLLDTYYKSNYKSKYCIIPGEWEEM